MINVTIETGNNRRPTVAKAVEALGDDFITRCKEAHTILIKVNLVHHEIQIASTHIDAVRGVLDVIRTHSAAKIFVGDASYCGTVAAFRNFGYDRLLEEYDNLELVDLNDDEFVPGYSIKADGTHNPIRRSKIASQADLKISLTPMKIHRDVGVTLSVKNWSIGTWIVPSRISVSGRVWARWPWLHEEGSLAHHRTIMELYRQLPCDVGIIDGITAMEGDGPSSGTALQMNVVVAGMDAVAVDAVATTLMGIEPRDIGYLAMCEEEGLGSVDMTHIDVPPMLMHELTRQFEKPANFDDIIKAWRQK
ncbi:MAG: DUF362 domain-containing protein [Patescibacteria group bacterium]|nr:DUF362 domain-containing protein [Patescibacteria group bacterium]